MVTGVRQIPSADDMDSLGAELSLLARPGQVIFLEGNLGAGKSVLARGFIRALSGDARLEVPSPTFTLVQTYDETRIPVAHADLYRLTSAAEVAELGLEELARHHIVIVEWPDRIRDWSPADCLSIRISGTGHSRSVTFEACGTAAASLSRNEAIRNFLAATDWKGARRIFLEGDASFRRYEALERHNGERAILMDMPARPDGPPVKYGKPYSAIAHLAESIGAVVAVNRELLSRGYGAPEIYSSDIQSGLAVIEDLGSRVYGRMRLAGESMVEPMHGATAVLADMAQRSWPENVPVSATEWHHMPPYDLEAQLIEVDLLPSWFWPYLHGVTVPEPARESFEQIWRSLLSKTKPGHPVWVLRDYHSPNLLWLPERNGLRRVGLIDTQDCVLGHPAYDLASLLQDARVDIDAIEERELFNYYCSLRENQPGFDRKSFEEAYAILGAQRATKILGIFARLSKRDGKHGYLRHLPRVSGYLERNLAHPSLAALHQWFEGHLPRTVREAQR